MRQGMNLSINFSLGASLPADRIWFRATLFEPDWGEKSLREKECFAMLLCDSEKLPLLSMMDL